MGIVRITAVALALATVAASQEPAYVGAEACGACHAEQFASQGRSAHATALRPATRHPLTEQFVVAAAARDGRWAYDFERRADGSLEVVLRKGDDVYERVVDWAFGSGYQAVTFVSQVDDDAYLEHHLSYYSRLDRLGLTPGHQPLPTETPEQAFGLRYPTFSPRSEILRCFSCHSTGPLELTEDLAVQPTELGVRCESCHGPGSEHIARIEAGEPAAARAAIDNPGRLDAAALMVYCGNCHRPPASDGEAIDWRDPWNVRHQPIYLRESACFQKSPSGLRCMDCHDPHEPIRRDDPAYYDARCKSCHADSHEPEAAGGCAGCHLPGVEPQTELTFHNHWIGIYGDDLLRPLGSRPASAFRSSATNGSSGP